MDEKYFYVPFWENITTLPATEEQIKDYNQLDSRDEKHQFVYNLMHENRERIFSCVIPKWDKISIKTEYSEDEAESNG